MLCDLCHNKQASNHIQMIVEGKKKTLNLCAECAAEKNIGPNMFDGAALAELIYNFADVSKALTDPADDMAEFVCPTCELSSQELKKTGLLGCPECYDVFRPFLLEALPSMHKGVAHVGKILNDPAIDETASGRADRGPRINQLGKQLQEAIRLENYEKAAEIRDQIRSLEEPTEEAGGNDPK